MNMHLNEDYKDKYLILERIAHEFFSDVYKAKVKDTGQLRALKIFSLENYKLEQKQSSTSEFYCDYELKKYVEKLEKEAENMVICGTNNDNSVTYYESYKNDKEFVIVMELCDANLNKIIKENKNFNLEEIYEILCQLNNTFRIMKENHIVHRDLKPDNILLKYTNGKYKIKLSDYGISTRDNLTNLKTHIGTFSYMAPEIMALDEIDNRQKEYDYKCDLWSLGVIIYELCFKTKPYNGRTEISIYENIKRNGNSLFKKTGFDRLDDLISKLLVENPQKRLTWDEYFNHPFFKEYNCIELKYKPNERGSSHIVSCLFAENKSNSCKIKYKNKYYPLEHYFETFEDILEIKIIGHINDMSMMFFNTDELINISESSIWNTDNVTSMKKIFYGCNLQGPLPDISNWNTANVTDMSYMFDGCYKLEMLPDLSKWNTSRVTNMSYMFNSCKSLLSLPDISTWDTSKVINISNIFCGCASLVSLPDISKWNMNNAKDFSGMFQFCCSLVSLPDISLWNVANVNNMCSLFHYCYSLTSLPDISKWNIGNVRDISYMFYYCRSLEYLPDLSKWVPYNNDIKVNNMLDLCIKLKELPNLSNISNKIEIKQKMKINFKNCSETKPFEVYPLDKIGEIYCYYTGIPGAVFIYNKFEISRILDDGKTFEDYFITNEDKLTIAYKIRGCDPIPIKIKYRSTIAEIKTCLCRKIDELKKIIHKKLFFKPEKQHLFYNGINLDNAMNQLYELNIRENSILNLQLEGEFENSIDYEQKYKNQIKILENLGFTQEGIKLDVLKQCYGDLKYYFSNIFDY